MEKYRASHSSVKFGLKEGGLAARFQENNTSIDSLKSAPANEHSCYEPSDPSFQLSSHNPYLSTTKQDDYLFQVPIMIGDRVVVGRTDLCGTVAYIGPTHFSVKTLAGIALDSPKGRHDGVAYGIRYFRCQANCGIFCPLSKLFRVESRELSPNTRFRVSKQPTFHLSQSTGIDGRRFSIKPTCTRAGLVKFRLQRGSAFSVIGRVSPVRCTHRGIFGSRRAQSLKGKVKRPVWLPAGSHDLQCSGIWSGYQRCRSSLQNQSKFLTKYPAFDKWNEISTAKRLAHGASLVADSACSPRGGFPCVSKGKMDLSEAPSLSNKYCAQIKQSSDAVTGLSLPRWAPFSQRTFGSLRKTALRFKNGKPTQSREPGGDSAITIQPPCSWIKGTTKDSSNLINSVQNCSILHYNQVLNVNKSCTEAEKCHLQQRECSSQPLHLNDREMVKGLSKNGADPLSAGIQPKSEHHSNAEMGAE